MKNHKHLLTALCTPTEDLENKMQGTRWLAGEDEEGFVELELAHTVVQTWNEHLHATVTGFALHL